MSEATKYISLIQLTQLVVSLTTTIHNALTRGDEVVSEVELSDSFANMHAALDALQALIEQKKAE